MKHKFEEHLSVAASVKCFPHQWTKYSRFLIYCSNNLKNNSPPCHLEKNFNKIFSNIMFHWYAAYLICSFWFHTEVNLQHLKQLKWRFLCQQLTVLSHKELHLRCYRFTRSACLTLNQTLGQHFVELLWRY